MNGKRRPGWIQSREKDSSNQNRKNLTLAPEEIQEVPRQTLMFLWTGSACRNAFPIWARGPSICSGCSPLRHAISCACAIGVLSLTEAGFPTCVRNAPGCGVPMKICGHSARTQGQLSLHGQIIQFRMFFEQVQGFHLLTQIIVKPM